MFSQRILGAVCLASFTLPAASFVSTHTNLCSNGVQPHNATSDALPRREAVRYSHVTQVLSDWKPQLMARYRARSVVIAPRKGPVLATSSTGAVTVIVTRYYILELRIRRRLCPPTPISYDGVPLEFRPY